jgi:DNA-binding transcriptional LysR family regulator
VVVDVMYPSPALAAALQDFAQRFPSVALALRVEALGAVADLVLRGEAALGVAGPLAAELAGLEREWLGAVELIPVASPAHRLVHGGALGEEVQLVLTDRSALSQGRDFSVFSARTWRLGDLGAKHELLRAGLGWGNMPRWMVADDLASGRSDVRNGRAAPIRSTPSTVPTLRSAQPRAGWPGGWRGSRARLRPGPFWRKGAADCPGPVSPPPTRKCRGLPF